MIRGTQTEATAAGVKHIDLQRLTFAPRFNCNQQICSLRLEITWEWWSPGFGRWSRLGPATVIQVGVSNTGESLLLIVGGDHSRWRQAVSRDADWLTDWLMLTEWKRFKLAHWCSEEGNNVGSMLQTRVACDRVTQFPWATSDSPWLLARIKPRPPSVLPHRSNWHLLSKHAKRDRR